VASLLVVYHCCLAFPQASIIGTRLQRKAKLLFATVA
jgi:hypothetical protein